MDAASKISRAHRGLFGKEHYYVNDKPQCSQRAIVNGKICVCELVANHPGEHEHISTRCLARAEDYENFPAFDNF